MSYNNNNRNKKSNHNRPMPNIDFSKINFYEIGRQINITKDRLDQHDKKVDQNLEYRSAEDELGLNFRASHNKNEKSLGALHRNIQHIMLDLKTTFGKLTKDLQTEYIYRAAPTITDWYYALSHKDEKTKLELFKSLMNEKIAKRIKRISKEEPPYTFNHDFVTVLTDLLIYIKKNYQDVDTSDITDELVSATKNIIKKRAKALSKEIPMETADISVLLTTMPSPRIFENSRNYTGIMYRVRSLVMTMNTMSKDENHTFVLNKSLIGQVLSALCTNKYLDDAVVAIASQEPLGDKTDEFDVFVFEYLDLLAGSDFQRCSKALDKFMEFALVDNRREAGIEPGGRIEYNQQSHRRLEKHLIEDKDKLKEALLVKANDHTIPNHKKFYIR